MYAAQPKKLLILNTLGILTAAQVLINQKFERSAVTARGALSGVNERYYPRCSQVNLMTLRSEQRPLPRGGAAFKLVDGLPRGYKEHCRW